MRLGKNLANRLMRKVFFDDKIYILSFFSSLFFLALATFFNLEIIYFVIFTMFPFVLLIKVNRQNFLLSLPLITGLSSIFLLVFLTFINLFNLPISISTAVIIVYLEIFISLFINIKMRRSLFKNILENCDNVALLAIYVFFILAALSRLASIYDVPVPLVNDPESHAFWAKRIIEEHSINYFYSPGLHIFTALTSQIGDLSIARTVNFLTNFLSSLTVFYWGLAAYVVSRKRLVATFVAFFVLVSPLPANLYFLAGKNALVAALPFIGLLIIVAYCLYRRATFANIAILSILLIGIGILHYPVYAYALGYIGLLSLFIVYKKIGLSNINNYLKNLYVYLIPIFLSLAFVAALIYITHSRNVESATVRSSQASKIFHQNVEETGIISEEKLSYYEAQGKSPEVTIHNPIKAPYALLDYITQSIEYTSKEIGLVIFGLVFASAYFVINQFGRTNSKTDIMTISSTSLLLSLLLVMLPFSIFVTGSTLNLVPDTGKFLIFIFGSFSLGMLFGHISKIKYYYIFIVLFLLGIWSSVSVYSSYTNHNKKSSVNNNDLMAFNWINDNVSKKEGFIGLAKLNPSRNTVVYPIDGSSWIPVFTHSFIANPFEENGFISYDTHINYEYTKQLTGPIDEYRVNSAKYFIAHNYDYIYIDGEKAYEKLNIDTLIKENIVKIVYKNKEVQIAKLSL